MDELDHERMRDQVAAHVLGTLGPNEEAELQEHLRTCEACARDVRWLQPAAGALLESVEPMEPPPELRARVMDEVRADAARRQTAAESSRGRFWDFLLRPATALAVAALFIVGVGGYVIANGDGDAGSDPSPPLANCKVPGNLICATLEREGNTGTLQVSGLRELGGDQVYQAWVQHDDVMADSSLFVPRSDGTATAAIPRDDLQGGDAVLVTIEPHGGSTQPTTEPLVSVDID